MKDFLPRYSSSRSLPLWREHSGPSEFLLPQARMSKECFLQNTPRMSGCRAKLGRGKRGAIWYRHATRVSSSLGKLTTDSEKTAKKENSRGSCANIDRTERELQRASLAELARPAVDQEFGSIKSAAQVSCARSKPQ